MKSKTEQLTQEEIVCLGSCDGCQPGKRCSKIETVGVIASGYEWICPQCNKLNKIIAIPRNPLQPCAECKFFSELDIPEHARD